MLGARIPHRRPRWDVWIGRVCACLAQYLSYYGSNYVYVPVHRAVLFWPAKQTTMMPVEEFVQLPPSRVRSTPEGLLISRTGVVGNIVWPVISSFKHPYQS